jgi:hypothetical protein
LRRAGGHRRVPRREGSGRGLAAQRRQLSLSVRAPNLRSRSGRFKLRTGRGADRYRDGDFETRVFSRRLAASDPDHSHTLRDIPCVATSGSRAR